MTTYRCAIIRLGVSPGSMTPMRSVLFALRGIECLGGECTDPTAAQLDAAIFAASPVFLHELLERVHALHRERPECAILVTGAGFDARQISAVFGAGAHDFFDARSCPDEWSVRVYRALGLVPNHAAPIVREALHPHMRTFVGRSPAFAKQIAKLPTIAGCDAGVLILGETGTGKEVCAQAIHYMSARASKPWIAVNCGAVPVELVESELFGHVRGAYTTANTSREGLVAEAEGGTLFLDDIDTLPFASQAKLLRFLQEHEYRAVGSNTLRRADVRVIAASNRNLGMLAASGEFRRDLYFRLNILTLTMPALRERREDIPELAIHFLEGFSRKHRRRAPTLGAQSLKRLLAYDWPGNVRELQHVLERAFLLSQASMLSPGEIDLPDAEPAAEEGESFRRAKDRIVQQFERTYIENLLLSCEGNVTHAAHEAKKNRRAFFELIRKHGIEPQRFRPGYRQSGA